ncbi:hypothetical protein [Kitasatospora sp. SUK 42]|uniref:hypothetical protein n=1 Tax=Kitasatospora sp. SUK 42 TaxID=1588882 RepID=UPI0018CA6BFE|nr:hypothetical protein [Kitasatospora sp. SUK 42]MBV2153142.1 hypothetical protein [Kitasatospora sp. SUK 42]
MVDVAHIIPSSPDDPPPPPPWWRRALPWLAGLTVAAVVGGGLWVWKPWQSVELPQSACWGVLDHEAIRPFVGNDGKAVAHVQGDLSAANPLAECSVSWSPRGGLAAIDATVMRTDGSLYQHDQARMADDIAQGRATEVAVGDHAKAWVDSVNASLIFPCPVPDSGRRTNVSIMVTGDPRVPARPARELVQNRADFILKLAKEVVQREGCPDIHLVDHVTVAPVKS